MLIRKILRELLPKHEVRRHIYLSATTCQAKDNNPSVKQSSVKVNYDYEYLASLSKEKLVYRIQNLQRQLDSYIYLKNPKNIDGRDKLKVDYPAYDEIIDHNKYNIRHVAFKVIYIGWDYVCYANDYAMTKSRQFIGTTNNIERVITEALLRQQVVSSFQRRLQGAGRTDKDVSGLSQVVTSFVRTNLDDGYGVQKRMLKEETNSIEQPYYFEDTSGNFTASDTSNDSQEVDYVSLLNAALPNDIRVIAWSPAPQNFQPRSNALKRTYRYCLPRGNLDIKLMNEAAQQFVGEHDFRNFCKISYQNVFKQFIKTIHSVSVTSAGNDPCDLCHISVTGSGFLQQQVRKMTTVLYYIGKGHESPDVVETLLNIDKTPIRPAYPGAGAHPLLLYDVEYEDDLLHWRHSQSNLQQVCDGLGDLYSEYGVKADIIKTMFTRVHGMVEDKEAASASTNTKLFGSDNGRFIEVTEDSKSIEQKREKFQKVEVRRLYRKGRFHQVEDLMKDHERKNKIFNERKNNNVSNNHEE